MKKSTEIALMGLLVVSALGLPACSSLYGSGTGDEQVSRNERIDEPVIKHIAPPDPSLASRRSGPTMRAELAARNDTGMPKGSLADVLFDFDRYTIRAEAVPALEANAKRLRRQGVTGVLLEGRGDEVGTAAYNMVLGDLRARNVKQYLEDLGLDVEVDTTSYGKDRPLCFRHDDDCMQVNRSVHFVVKQ
ncbi:putative Peptidoglycan-associated lipoprotein [Nitrospira japonica]|uniref:Putative Peptidoglycan-associated lipoprotein n=1 Tax=Nitrospira japonica TaxID=1325564 RepID=A0A1W1I9L8_9BACT|nr:OmpA family protein [Nitrospira japonica]SLM49493.1 putative Peptidoglycan-associated lipoprotein [Nitrospira japonica]